MFILIVIMVAACVWIEMRIINSIPAVGKICEKNKVLSLIFSFVLSMVMGAAFGAAGLIVFAAGIISTVVIQPWYRMRANGTVDRFHAAKKQAHVAFGTQKAKWDANKDVYARRFTQVVTGIKAIFKIVMFPFMIVGMIMDRIDVIMKAVEDAGARVARFFRI